VSCIEYQSFEWAIGYWFRIPGHQLQMILPNSVMILEKTSG
jgi:hypothetical protein